MDIKMRGGGIGKLMEVGVAFVCWSGVAFAGRLRFVAWFPGQRAGSAALPVLS